MYVAANITNGNLMFVKFLVESFDEITAALLIHRRDSQADHLSVIVWIDAQVRFLNSLLNVNQHLLFPRLNNQKASLRDSHRSDLINGHRSAVVIDEDTLKQCGACASGTNTGEIML